jgi:hypothetical protein
MKLAATITRLLHAHMQAEMHDVARLLANGTREAGRSPRTSCAARWRGGHGQRLPNSWRDKHYPRQRLHWSLRGPIGPSLLVVEAVIDDAGGIVAVWLDNGQGGSEAAVRGGR